MYAKNNRLKVWWEILALPTWKWLIVAPLGALGTGAFIRDELLKPEIQARYKLLKLLPHFTWEWYALLIVVIIIFIVLECAFQTIQKREEELEKLLDIYAYSLKLESITREEQHQVDEHGSTVERHGRFVLKLKNTSDKPIKYEISELTINNTTQGNFLSKGSGISPHSEASFYSELVAIPSTQKDSKESAKISLEILYGPADKNPTRKMTKKMNLEIFPRSQQLTYLYEEDKDIAL